MKKWRSIEPLFIFHFFVSIFFVQALLQYKDVPMGDFLKQDTPIYGVSESYKKFWKNIIPESLLIFFETLNWGSLFSNFF